MHEMAIAEGILDIALDYAAQNEAKRIVEVGLIIGEMAGVVSESLEMSWHSLTPGTIAEGAELKIKQSQLIGHCPRCKEDFHLQEYKFWCPTCQDSVLEIISGREMQVEYLEIE